jgi:hypothetical protein
VTDERLDKALKPFPAPLLTELIEGRWLPVVGAGMSRNAVTPDGRAMPLWDGLGRAVANDVPGYAYVGAIDAISAYEQTFGRRELVNRLHRELLVGVAQPGDAHAAFSHLRFDRVVTTNIEFLLERGYESAGERLEVLVDEDQLPIPAPSGTTVLVKLHGDLRHPKRLVVTEDDYDGFLSRYPVLATHLSSLLIERIPVFIGYSLDDPDFRQILATLRNRLGKMLPTAYVIAVKASAQVIAQYERRGIKVVNLPQGRGSYGEALAASFRALDEFWRARVLEEVRFNEEAPLAQIRATPRSEPSRLCYFSIPLALLAFYRDEVFPLAEQAGLVPVSGFDVEVEQGNRLAATRELIQRSGLAVIDMSEGGGSVELRVVLDVVGIENVLVISPTPSPSFLADGGLQVVLRPASLREDRDGFLDRIAAWFDHRALEGDRGSNAERLLENKEWTAALVAAVSELEVLLRERASGFAVPQKTRGRGLWTLRQLILDSGFDDELQGRLLDWVAIRNSALHEGAAVRPVEAGKAVSDVRVVRQLIDDLREP